MPLPDGEVHERHERWVRDWRPDDPGFWHRQGRRLATRNLLVSVLSEHVGFSIWSLWSVLALFMAAAGRGHFDSGELFLLISLPTLTGAALRVPYSLAVTRFGGRTWTTFSSAILLVPAVLTLWLLNRPDSAHWVYFAVAATAGVGGGNFASSMTNIAGLFPQRLQGRALGLNAGGGNLGVALAQLVGLLVIATAGLRHPGYVVAVYLPLIVVVTVLAHRRMDDVAVPRPEPGVVPATLREPHTWLLSLLYLCTFGSFIGYGGAFGLVLHLQFGLSPITTAGYTFLGPLLGSFARPVGGWLADRWGGARLTIVSLSGLSGGTAVLVVATHRHWQALFIAAFAALFVLSGIGNGSTYKMIPAVFAGLADRRADTRLWSPDRARQMSGVVIGIAGAVGALGGTAINLAFRFSFSGHGDGVPAFLAFLLCYAVCVALTWAVYLRDEPAPEPVLVAREGADA